MSLLRLALKSLSGHAFRSLGVFLSALLVAGFALATSLILRGAEQSLRLAVDRLGADILVIPEGSTARVEGAILMGKPLQAWLPEDAWQKVAAVPGVAAASPQLYLGIHPGTACCGAEEVNLVAFDPATDFSLQPWLESGLPFELGPGEGIAGEGLALAEGQVIELSGTDLHIQARLAPTGTRLDQSLFLTFETARALARSSQDLASQAPLQGHSTGLSAILVRVQPGVDPYAVSLEIMHSVPGVTPVENLRLFGSYRRQLRSLLGSLLALSGLTLGLSLALVTLVFTLAANERRRELGVLRALGAPRAFVFVSLLSEAAGLALAGGVTGAGLAVLVLSFFHRSLVHTLGLPFSLPTPSDLIAHVVVGSGIALVSIALAATLPALRISRMDPALAMRE